VVADEVRTRAERTSSAMIECEKMIASIQPDTALADGVRDAALPQVAASVHAAEGAQSTPTSIRDVADATREQSVVSNSIAQTIEEIATMVNETISAMHSKAQTAAEVEKIAAKLGYLVSRFRC